MKSEITTLPKNQKIMVRLKADTDEEEKALLGTMLAISADVITVWSPVAKTLNILIPYDRRDA